MNSREYEQLNMIIMLSEEQEKTFNKYGFIYESEDLKNRVNTQKYMYSVLKNKKMDNTSVEKLFDLLETDIKLQYEMKAHMENKSGFLIALCILAHIKKAHTDERGGYSMACDWCDRVRVLHQCNAWNGDRTVSVSHTEQHRGIVDD